jgi:hypothetical protein
VKIGGSALFAASATAAALALPALGAHASRTAPAVSGDTYLVTLTGTQQSVAAYTGSVRDDAGCTYRVNNADRQLLTFSAERRLRLVLHPGRTLPKLDFTARVGVAGSRHRESELTNGDKDACNPSQPPRTKRCGARVLQASLALRPAGQDRVVLGGGFTPDGERVACSPTLTKPDRFLVPSESRLKIPPGIVRRLFAKSRLHSTFRGENDGITKTTDVRWTIVLKRAP